MKNISKVKKIFPIVGILIFAFVGTVFFVRNNNVFANELDEIKEQKDEKQAEKDRRSKELKSVNYSINSTSGNLSYVSSRIKLAEEEIEAIKNERIELEALVGKLESDVAELDAQYKIVEDEHAEAVRSLYKIVNDNNDSAVYILSAVSNIDNATFFISIQNNLYSEIERFQDKYSILVESKMILDDSLIELEEKEIELEEWQRYLDVQKAEYQNLLIAQKAEKSRVLAQLQEIDQDIANLDAEARKIIAEKYPPTPSTGGGTGSKPVGSTVGAFKVTVRRGGSVVYDQYIEGPVRVSSGSPLVVNNSRLYRGVLEARKDTNVYLINELNFEDYVRGLGEVPSSWGANGMAVLEAQAITGRTYAAANLNKRVAYNYNLLDSVDDQNYEGYNKEIGSYSSYWVNAVNQTSGKVVTYGGVPIPTYYSSSASGHTLSSEERWGGYRVYAQAVSDWTNVSTGESYDTIGGSPYTKRNWGGGTTCDHGDGIVDYNDLVDLINGGIYFQLYGVNTTTSAIVRKPQRGGKTSEELAALLGANSIQNKVGTITGLQHVYNNGTSIASDTRRTEQLIITGTTGTYTIGMCSSRDNCFRQAYNIRSECSLAMWSTMWDVEFSESNTKFYSRGYGHRVGLSQYGAYGRAISGQSYTQIIQHYYTGTSIGSYNTSGNIRIGLSKVPSSYVIKAQSSGNVSANGVNVFTLVSGDEVSIVEQ